MVDFADLNNRGGHNWILQSLRTARTALGSITRGHDGPQTIRRITTSGQFIGQASESIESIKHILIESERIYRQGSSVVFLTQGTHETGACVARPITEGGVVTPTAAAAISNVVICEELKANSTGKGARPDLPAEYPVQFQVPEKVLQQVVCSDHFMAQIPEARFIVNSGCFDNDFRWLGKGYHEQQKILVCGEGMAPAELPAIEEPLDEPRSALEVIQRLPTLLGDLLRGFHWRGHIDAINYIGAALAGRG